MSMMINPYVFAASISAARPVFVAVQSSAVTGAGALSVTLPAGWAAGQLAILHVVAESSISTPSGWTAVESPITNGTGTSVLFWRVLQGGDSGPTLASSTDVAAIVWTFQSGTFNAANPVSQIATHNSAGGLSAAHTIPDSTLVPDGEHFVMHMDCWNGGFANVSTYPYASAQGTRAAGASPTFTRNSGCGEDFDGGISAGTGFTVSASTAWIGRKIVIIGNGYTP